METLFFSIGLSGCISLGTALGSAFRLDPRSVIPWMVLGGGFLLLGGAPLLWKRQVLEVAIAAFLVPLFGLGYLNWQFRLSASAELPWLDVTPAAAALDLPNVVHASILSVCAGVGFLLASRTAMRINNRAA